MGKKLSIPRISKLDINSINLALIEVYRNLNKIANSADEVSYTENKNGYKELVINDNGKKYVDNSKPASFGPNIHSLKTKVQEDIKKELSLNNVTNESKATMFTNPAITGEYGTGSNVALNTTTDNQLRVFANDASDHFEVRLIHNATTALRNKLSFFQGGTPRWNIGYIGDDVNILRVSQNTDLTTDVELTLNSSGNLTTAGTVTSSNGICGGTRHFIHAGFNYSFTGGTLIYVPINGYILESSGSSSRNEYQTFVAPYDGYLNQVVVRSEEVCGDTIVGLHKSPTGTETPNATAAVGVTVDMDTDDTPYKFAFSSNNTFDAGDILAISFDPTNDANDTVCTIELIFDIGEGL